MDCDVVIIFWEAQPRKLFIQVQAQPMNISDYYKRDRDMSSGGNRQWQWWQKPEDKGYKTDYPDPFTRIVPERTSAMLDHLLLTNDPLRHLAGLYGVAPFPLT